MAVFNTIEELVEILDENPQWIEALRARLLTRELRELPEKFAEFAEKTDKRLGSLEQRFAEFVEKMDKIQGGSCQNRRDPTSPWHCCGHGISMDQRPQCERSHSHNRQRRHIGHFRK